PGLRLHLLFGRRLGAAQRAGRGDREAARGLRGEAAPGDEGGDEDRQEGGGAVMAAPFRVALSGDFRKADGSPVYPDFDLAPLRNAPDVEAVFLEPSNPIRADQLADFDALILLAARFDAGSIPAGGRLAVVARFGVGYDTVDVDACTGAGIALVITP